MEQKKNIQLSPSALSLYKECTKCFWLHRVKGIYRPKPSFALQNVFDEIIKEYFDMFRKAGKMPPEIKNKVQGQLMPDIDLLNKWRNALNPALRYVHPKYDNFSLAGGIDDCLYDEDKKVYIPIDFKTTGSDNYDKNSIKYYQHQLDIYSFLLKQNGYPTNDKAYLIYYKPKTVLGEGVVKFKIIVKEMQTSDERALGLFEEGIKALQGPMPDSHKWCDFCKWVNEYIE
jgi:hypothetical protein